MITITHVYKNVNIPTILILPAFCNLLEPEPLITRQGQEIPLLVWLYKQGFDKCLLDLDTTTGVPLADKIVFKLHKSALKNTGTIKSKFPSIAARLVSYDLYEDTWTNDPYIYIKYNIPEHVKDDINHIIESDYTKVSEKFMNLSRANVDRVPKWKSNLGCFMIKHNMAVAVFKRHESIRDVIENHLDIKLPDNVDFVRKFDFDLDCFDY